MSDSMLALSTQVKPAKKFTVDGEEYQLLGLEHISKEGEAEALALLSRHSLLMIELENTANVTKGKVVAERLRECRLRVIRALTDLPKETAETLPLHAQAQLLEAVVAEMSYGDDDEETDASGDEEE